MSAVRLGPVTWNRFVVLAAIWGFFTAQCATVHCNVAMSKQAMGMTAAFGPSNGASYSLRCFTMGNASR